MTNEKGIEIEIEIETETETEKGTEKGTGTVQLQRHSYLVPHTIPYLLHLLPGIIGPMVIWVVHILLVVLVHHFRCLPSDFIHLFQEVLDHQERYPASQTLLPLHTSIASRPTR